jgi:hypothetical protein
MQRIVSHLLNQEPLLNSIQLVASGLLHDPVLFVKWKGAYFFHPELRHCKPEIITVELILGVVVLFCEYELTFLLPRTT